jgi:capsular polysaccharide biosynthesis protein
MTIQEYIRILRQRGWIIMAAALIAAIAAFGVSYFQQELYRATVNVSTVPARADWGLTNTATELMRNFAMNARTLEVAQKVIARAQLDKNPYELLGNLQVEPDASTFMIKVQARDRDPDVASLIALTVADEFVEERTQYYAQQDKRDRIEVKIVSRAIEPEMLQPKPRLNAIAGGVLGMLFGVALVLLLTWLEADLLRTPLAVERTLGLPVLGAIPPAGYGREAAGRSLGPARSGQIPMPKTA